MSSNKKKTKLYRSRMLLSARNYVGKKGLVRTRRKMCSYREKLEAWSCQCQNDPYFPAYRNHTSMCRCFLDQSEARSKSGRNSNVWVRSTVRCTHRDQPSRPQIRIYPGKQMHVSCLCLPSASSECVIRFPCRQTSNGFAHTHNKKKCSSTQIRHFLDRVYIFGQNESGQQVFFLDSEGFNSGDIYLTKLIYRVSV